MGRKVFLLMAGFAMAVSCGLQEIGDGSSTGDDIWKGPGSVISGGSSGAGVGKKVWYAVGVDYPKGYDWMADEKNGSVMCSLVVFANGIPMMKVPVGDEYETSADPDMCRMIGDCLYTDYSTETETIVKRNGKELLRYPGREMIIDMAVQGEYLYTLGQNRNGSGFSFRRNGEVLIERSSGYVFPRLQLGEDGYSFSFCEVIGEYERYFHYLAGEVCQVAVRDDIKKIWDVIYVEDKLCYLASMVGISAPVLANGQDMMPLAMPAGSEVVSCRFVTDSRELNIEGVISQKGKALFSGLWKGNKLIKMFSPGYVVTCFCANGDDVSCILNPPENLSAGIIYHAGESFTIPDGYKSMGGRSMTMLDGLLYVGLTSTEISDERASMWVDEEMKPLKINGFISNISIN